MIRRIKRWLSRKYIKRVVLALSRLTAFSLNRYMPDNTAYGIFSEYGFHLLRKHYYLPIPDENDLGEAFWEERSQLVGLEMNDSEALNLLENVFPTYMEEFRARFPIHPPSDSAQFHLINGTFMAIDAHVYYSFIRHFTPKRIIEIGAGQSTLLAAATIQEQEMRDVTHLTAIEPFPTPLLKKGVPGLSRLVEDKIQNVGLDLFASLESGDILFIDSTHVLRAGCDVQR